MSNQIFIRAREFLFGRAAAYRRIFNKTNLDAMTVLADLAKFCRAHEATGHPNPHVAARLDGRREVWLRIQCHLKLTDEDLWMIYGGKAYQPQQKEIDQ